MIRRRIGLAQLMALIAVLALGLAAMKVASDLAAQGVVLGSIVALLVAMLGARVRRDRGPWAGFALFGQAYLLIVAVPWVVPQLFQIHDNTSIERLKIDGIAVELADWLHPELPEPPLAFQAAMNNMAGTYQLVAAAGMRPFTPPEQKAFDTYQDLEADRQDRLRAHSCATWIGLAIQGVAFASLGALAGRYLTRTDRHPAEAAAPRPSTDALP